MPTILVVIVLISSWANAYRVQHWPTVICSINGTVIIILCGLQGGTRTRVIWLSSFKKKKSFLSLQNKSTPAHFWCIRPFTMESQFTFLSTFIICHTISPTWSSTLMDLLLFPENAFENELPMECPSLSPTVPLRPNLNILFFVKYSPYAPSSASPHGT